MLDNSALFIDIGNTNLKWWLCAGENIQSKGSSSSSEAQLHTLIECLAITEVVNGRAISVYIASVKSKAFTQSLAIALNQHFEVVIKQFVVVPDLAGLTIAYKQPGTLGVDRWLGMHAAKSKLNRGGDGCSVYISAGSAITVDYINHVGLHLGGVIAPGIGMQRAMLNSTDRSVTESRNIEPSKMLGVTTQSCVDVGMGLMLSGFIDKILQQVCAFSGSSKVVVAGGDGQLIVNLLEAGLAHGEDAIEIYHRPDSVLIGMQLMSSFDVCLEQVVPSE